MMSYNSKRTITSMAGGVILLAAYIIYAFGVKAPASESLAAWAKTMLIFIGIGVVGSIVIQILFRIVYAIGVAVKEREHCDKDVERMVSSSMVEDERDKLVGLKAARIGYFFAGIGFLAALAALAFGASGILALHMLFVTFFIGSLMEGAMSVYYYERGVHNG